MRRNLVYEVLSLQTSKEETEFWAMHDSTEYLDEIQSVEVSFVDPRIPKKLISVRFDNETIESRKKGIGYQALIRIWVNERLAPQQAGRTG